MCETTPRAERAIPQSPEAPTMARSFLRHETCVVHTGAVVEDAVLLVSELVTNSVLHGGPPIVVAVECDGTALQVRVRDGGATLPQPRHAAAGDESGRGLELVDLLSSDWGVDPFEEGKHVWFVLRAGGMNAT
jgi:anti-sigma regulatory factor (Ser/Thr protein kinase)